MCEQTLSYEVSKIRFGGLAALECGLFLFGSFGDNVALNEFAALEMLAAVLILIVPPALVIKVAEFVTSGEFGQDPDDPIATTILDAAHTFTVHSHYLLALYLVLHGAIKVFLVIGILRGKRIAYPLFMLALAVFGGYEAYRGFARHEFLLEVIAVFDLSVLVLTSYEYHRRFPKSVEPTFA